MADMFLIEKRGLYYRPEARGYTGLKREAGRYSFEEAAERVSPNGPDGPQDGMGMWREDEAPEFSSACAWDVRLVERTRKEARAEAFREAINVATASASMGGQWATAAHAIAAAIEDIMTPTPQDRRE